MKNSPVSLILTALLFSSSALADGFICSFETGLKVQVYNQTQPSLGTRNASLMIVSDKTIEYGRKTVAKFTAEEGLLTQDLSKHAVTYIGIVDHRFNNTSRKGELIAGTKIGNVDYLTLEVDHSFLSPIDDGEFTSGILTVYQRNGKELQFSGDCERYLKN
jgi:hypothetical protein